MLPGSHELPWNLAACCCLVWAPVCLLFYAWRASIGPKWANACGLIGGLAGIVWLQALRPIPCTYGYDSDRHQHPGYQHLGYWFVRFAGTRISRLPGKTMINGRYRPQF